MRTRSDDDHPGPRAYIVAALLFILALAGLSRHESARMGNRYGIIGMTIALVITIIAATAGGCRGEANDTSGSGPGLA